MSGKEELDNAIKKLRVEESPFYPPGENFDCKSLGTSGLGVKEGKSDFVRQTIDELKKDLKSKVGE
ncbi:MAG: hypothetical protein C9356_20080 [Oleiphilus sp.]|nr:MAG: hypothetical protein C9356_20080 [Oleiphilus sp.]